MGARLTRRRNRGDFKHTITPDVKPSKNNQLNNGIDCNGNILVSQNGNNNIEKPESEKKIGKTKANVELPLADKYMSIERAQRMLVTARSQALSDLSAADFIPDFNELSAFNFPFENAVFEGGGVKGIAYIGALKCLEDAGIKMKRFAGASIGASVAGFLSVGFTADEMVALYLQDLSIFIHDSRCELLCFLPRLAGNLGLNPGKKFFDWYGRCLSVKTNNPDITFRQVYERFGTELCVIVLNMNTGREEYCHPKTTPDLAIRKAIRMSISVPGVLQPQRLSHVGGNSNLYVDGGIICNYPIYAFDGWWLSMKPKHCIYNTIHRLQADSDWSRKDPVAMLCHSNSRFCKRNHKTLGFTQTANNGFFNDRYTSNPSRAKHSCPRPKTKLTRRRMKRLQSLEKSSALQSNRRGALLKLFEVLNECSNSHGYVIRDQLMSALSKDRLTDSEITVLFGKHFSLSTLLDNLPGVPTDSSTTLISPRELDDYLMSYGLDMHRVLEETMVVTEDVKNISSFCVRLQRHVTNAARRNFIKHEDIARTVNIHTDYIEFLDFEICDEDKIFLMQQGYRYTLTYLQDYMLRQRKLKEATPTLLDEPDGEERLDLTCNNDESATICYIDDDDSYSKWLCTLPLDNISLPDD